MTLFCNLIIYGKCHRSRLNKRLNASRSDFSFNKTMNICKEINDNCNDDEVLNLASKVLQVVVQVGNNVNAVIMEQTSAALYEI